MNLVEIRAPDVATLSREVTFVESAVAAGSLSITVKNTQGFTSSSVIAVGTLFTDECEGATISGAPAAGALPVTSLALSHKRGVPVIKLRYDYYRLWRDTAYDGTFASEITTTGGEPFELDQQECFKTDSTGTSAHWYKITHKSSVSGEETLLADAHPFQAQAAIPFDPQVLRRDYLLGIRMVDFYGNPLRDDTLSRHIARAIARFETYLGASLYARDIPDERHDYYMQDYQAWGFLKADKHPVISVSSLKMQFPENENPITFPTEWIQIDEVPGILNLVPTHGSISQWILGHSIALPLLAARIEMVPGIWRLSYRAGFEQDDMPADIQDVVYKLASLSLMQILGDTVY